ncbi:hypothetical protein [Jannaschia seohaensis]|uniref:Uncharacterized protein n=1 Tax=Jannaschia seohaensis TaxID=475081 RepID=A0A2Y9A7A8_9RHOB|nr:hypothetical protein [Jannaschia seohaensis]PWJ22201.1 hypothetical protein BCF38_101611 [Jannaschia seohaensis]SSA38479.1 hypothetical protein SAMN05421539_101611 [Jannaschia seohaensis]
MTPMLHRAAAASLLPPIATIEFSARLTAAWARQTRDTLAVSTVFTRGTLDFWDTVAKGPHAPRKADSARGRTATAKTAAAPVAKPAPQSPAQPEATPPVAAESVVPVAPEPAPAKAEAPATQAPQKPAAKAQPKRRKTAAKTAPKTTARKTAARAKPPAKAPQSAAEPSGAVDAVSKPKVRTPRKAAAKAPQSPRKGAAKATAPKRSPKPNGSGQDVAAE